MNDGASPAQAAAQRLLDRRYGSEADICRAICDFLVETSLVSRDDLRQEENRIDIQSESLVIEVKRRTGPDGSAMPDPRWIEQLDGYLREARERGEPDRLGILTDGRRWYLRLPGVDEVRTKPPWAFTLKDATAGDALADWLRREAQAIERTDRLPAEGDIRSAFSEGPRFESGLNQLDDLYHEHRDAPTVVVKRELWRRLLTAALGVVAEEEPDLDHLFVRHTYLSAVVSMAVQSAFGLDIREQVERDPLRFLDGETFFSEVGVRGVIEPDFFAWPAESGGERWLATMAARVARFRWRDAEYDVARILYQSIIPAGDRRRLGEYYTPDWLAGAVVKEVVTEPLHQRVLDPACGSGTFLRAAVRAFIKTAREEGHDAAWTVERLPRAVTGIDIHPVSVRLARATWVLAAREVIHESGAAAQNLTVPVYLGDSLQLRTAPHDMFTADTVTITVEPPGEADDQPTRHLRFPRTLVEQGDRFDSVMTGIGEAIEKGREPEIALIDNHIPEGPDREMLKGTLREMQALHAEGRDHIWAYYTRNLVRPVWLASGGGQADAIVGNPPWLTYRRSDATLRDELRKLSQSGEYGLWAGGQYATHQDVAGLFFARCADLYLKEGGEMGMVLPHSILQAGQYRLWRGGRWGRTEVDLSERQPWDLERIEPNDFFPVPACVAFARKRGADGARPLARHARRWLGPVSGPFTYKTVRRADADGFASPYAERARQGATIVPRILFFIETETSSAAMVPGIIRATPEYRSQAKSPWKDLDPPELHGATEEEHVWPVHLGETVVPFATLEARQAALPLSREAEPPPALRSDEGAAIHGVDPALMGARMRERWANANQLWEAHKGANNRLDLLGQLDYMRKFSAQLDGGTGPRLLYTTSGRLTAAVLEDTDAIIDNRLYWLRCHTREEGDYLAAVLNSNALWPAVEHYMSKGQFGARDVHKHPWRLAIPEYDGGDGLHRELAEAGAQAAREASERLDALRQSREGDVGYELARRELRRWLESSPLGERIETLAARLLA